MDTAEAYADRAQRVLQSLVGLSGFTRREIHRRLQQQGAGVDVTRILRGELDLKLWHLVAILGVIDVHPLDFFQLVFPAPSQPRSPLVQLFEKAVGDSRLAPPASVGNEVRSAPGESAKRRLNKLMRELERLIEEAEMPEGG